MTGHRDLADVKAKELRSEVRYCAELLSGLDRGGCDWGRTGFGIVFHCVGVAGGGRLSDGMVCFLDYLRCCQLFLVGSFGCAGS